MKFEQPLIRGKLIKRYKRFLADVELENGEVVTAHCTNSGSMKSCIEAGAPVMLTLHDDPKRKTRFTWEMIYMNNGWIGINTLVPNIVVYEAIRDQQIEKLKSYTSVQREIKYGNSRLDIYAENEKEKCFVEVKNVTMKEDNYALFPDAVTSRGLKHLNVLKELKQKGFRAVMVYLIQRTDVEIFGPAKAIDPAYAKTLVEAYNSGVEIIPLQAEVSQEKIEIAREMSFEF